LLVSSKLVTTIVLVYFIGRLSMSDSWFWLPSTNVYVAAHGHVFGNIIAIVLIYMIKH